MSNNWNRSQLTELCSLIKRGITPKYSEDDGIVVVNQRCIRDNIVSFENARLHNLDRKKIPGEKYLENYDILVNSTGVGTLGRVAQIKEVNEDITADSHVTIVRSKPDSIDKKYLGYVLKSKEDEIEFLAEGSTGQTELSRYRLGELIIDYPESFNEQKSIAHILGTLDDKIELNRKMNQTLEEMAQALFKSWFVDFDPVLDKALAAGHEIPEPLQAKAEKRKALGNKRKALPQAIADLFPDRFVFTEELGWVPEEWKKTSLIDMVQIIGGGTPKTSIDKYWNGDIKWFSVVDAPNEADVFVINTEKKITNEGLNNSSTKLLPSRTCIISARGTVGKLAMVDIPIAMNQSCYGIKAKEEFSDYLNYYVLKSNITDLQSRGHGSVFNTITRDTFKSVEFAFPKKPNLLKYFDNSIELTFAKILKNVNQNAILNNIRDTLLPKLISGELRVSEVEKLHCE